MNPNRKTETAECYVCGHGFERPEEKSDDPFEDASLGSYVWRRVVCIGCKRFLAYRPANEPS